MNNNNEVVIGQPKQWGSMYGFLMSAIGYAVGLGAIWRFPYLIGSNGGGIFLVVMLVMSLLIAVPLIICELTLGRSSGRTGIVGMEALAGKKSPWVAIGWFGAIAATLLMSYYVMIAGNVAHYFFLSVMGSFKGTTGADMAPMFNGLMANTPLILFYNAALLALAAFIISKGVKGGIEAFAKVALPILFLFLVILAIKSLTLSGAGEAMRWFLTPDISKLTPAVLLSALSQTFFLAGVGLSSAFVFGSYLKEDANVARSGVIIVMSNMVVALLAGTAIFPAVFTYGVEPSSGSSLVFQTMPMMFENMAGGRIFGSLFFLLLFIAAFTSVLGLVEGIVATFADKFEMDRKKMTWIMVSIMFVIGLIPVLVYSPVLGNVTLFGKDLYTDLDFLAMSILVPVGGLMISLYAAWKFGFERLMKDVNSSANSFKVTTIWKPLLAIICPIIITIVIIVGIQSVYFA
ncbi:sodium-dependent transporter [Sinanaerobacter chloroacetimidivorans]|jgi:NSS family neurotransmitter:Na+ symporter|uniref:Transporter n=1 Tax=Sinanaerobacter chloroacetimidivorans TaxID=2818044 RepID=A0A8J7W0G2_9FIRM|nr:sodium-dependent transporter [Sinanaerobacter chloroacetimidivorans]MBR0598086.1 sodium-dependent transporter [Sinanaerobacter chloroacetimidivorans]